MTVPQFQDRLLRSFPEQTWSSLVKALGDGIHKADSHLRSTPMFSGEIGHDLRGHVRRLSILHELHELSRLGRLPYEASPSKMPVGNWHWLNIRSAGLIGHVIRTETPNALPQTTTNRQPLCVSNQYDLLKDGTIPPIDMVITKARYVYLTFGIDRAGTLTHVSLGMPSADNSEWLAFAKLARRAKPEPFFLPPPAPPTPPVAGELKFQPDVAQMLDGQDEKEAGKKSA